MNKLFLFFVILGLYALSNASASVYFDRTSVSLVVTERTNVLLRQEDQNNISNMIKQAKLNCDENKDDLLVTVDQIINEPSPRTGISGSTIVAVYLKKNGVQSIREGEITKDKLLSLHPEIYPVTLNSLEVEFSCTKEESARHE